MCVACQVFDGFQIRSERFDVALGVTLNKIAGNIKALLIIIKVDAQVEQLAGFHVSFKGRHVIGPQLHMHIYVAAEQRRLDDGSGATDNLRRDVIGVSADETGNGVVKFDTVPAGVSENNLLLCLLISGVDIACYKSK